MLWLHIFGKFVLSFKLLTLPVPDAQEKCRLTQVGLSILSFLDIVLVSRMNLTIGISDKTMVLYGSALADAVNQFKYVHLGLLVFCFVNSP